MKSQFLSGLPMAVAFAVTMGIGPALARDVSIGHAQGELTLPAAPQKIAVFDLPTLDIINAIGKSELVVAVPKSADRPANFPSHLMHFGDDAYAPAGTLFEPDAEVLEAVGPDMIVVGGRSRAKFDDMEEIAPTVDMSAGDGDPVADAIAKTESLGRLLDAEDAAAARIAAFEETVAGTRELGGKAGTGLLLFGAGEGLRAEAPGSRFGGVYGLIGIEPVVEPVEAETGPRPERGSPEAEAARKRQQEVLEAALAAEPDWIFTIDRNAAVNNTEIRPMAERLAEDERVTATKAWQEGRVVHLDSKVWYLMTGGIDAMTATAESVAAAFAEAAE